VIDNRSRAARTRMRGFSRRQARTINLLESKHVEICARDHTRPAGPVSPERMRGS